jgi:hypothetical protein
MATHNGERFLLTQLESLRAQEQLPAELIVRDDASTDGTMEVLERFARDAPFDVQITKNSTQLGPTETFLRAAEMARGQVIALCDQDDVWHHEKLRRCMKEFDRSDDVTLVVHSAWVVGDRRRYSPRVLPAYRRRAATAPAASPLHFPAYGFAMLFRRRLLSVWNVVANPPPQRFNRSWFAHDSWFAMLGAALGLLVRLPDRLAWYRQHGTNVWGARSTVMAGQWHDALELSGREAVAYHKQVEWAQSHIAVLRDLEVRARGSGVPYIEGGPTARAALWARYARVMEQRALLYRTGRRRERLSRFVRDMREGNYARRPEGGLGAASSLRDALYVSGTLGLVEHMLEHGKRTGSR